MTGSGGHNVPKSAEVAPRLQEAGGLAEPWTFRSRAKMYRRTNREVFARKVQHTCTLTTLMDYLKIICVFKYFLFMW